MDPFPELEIKFCHTILSKLSISRLIPMDREDITQEIILNLLEEQEAWQKLRAKSTSTTLIYTALRNKILNLIDKNMTACDIARHSPKEAKQEARNQIRNQEGSAWDVFKSLSKAEQRFIEEFYNPSITTDRTDLKHKHRITETQAARSSRKVLRSARLDLTRRTLIHLDKDLNQDLNV